MAETSPLVFYHSPNTRSSATMILLEELAVPFELKVIDMKKGEQRQPAYLAVNPMGKVPAIVHDGALVTESAQWGLVWRADVALADTRPGQVARAVCWNDQLQFVRGRTLPALPIATGASKRPAAVRCNYTPIDNPCRKEPVRILWLCVSPQLFLYADGHAEPSREDAALDVGFTNRGAPETDAAWAARCASKGGIYDGD